MFSIILVLLLAMAMVQASGIARINMAGIRRRARPIPENLVRTSAPATQQVDGLASATLWNDNWWVQIPDGNLFAFKTRRLYRYAFTMVLNDDAVPTAMPDSTEVRLIVRFADNLTFKDTIWIGTYGTIKNATKYDIETLITATRDMNVQPNEYLVLQTRHPTATLDISECSLDLGMTRWVPAN